MTARRDNVKIPHTLYRIGLLLVGIGLGLALVFGWIVTAQSVFADSATKGPPPVGSKKVYWAQVETVVDGDTFWAEGVKYRVAGIDTPETHADKRHGYKCRAEQILGEEATRYARVLIEGQKVRIYPTGAWDRYDRPLVRLKIGGEYYGEIMLKARLAMPWRGRKYPWCEALNY